MSLMAEDPSEPSPAASCREDTKTHQAVSAAFRHRKAEKCLCLPQTPKQSGTGAGNEDKGRLLRRQHMDKSPSHSAHQK